MKNKLFIVLVIFFVLLVSNMGLSLAGACNPVDFCGAVPGGSDCQAGQRCVYCTVICTGTICDGDNSCPTDVTPPDPCVCATNCSLGWSCYCPAGTTSGTCINTDYGGDDVSCSGSGCGDPVCGLGYSCDDGECVTNSECGAGTVKVPYSGPKITNFSGIIARFFNLLYPAAILFGILMIIKAGYGYMTSQGDPKAVSEAKEDLTAAVLGTIFVVLSVVLLQAIISQVLGG